MRIRNVRRGKIAFIFCIATIAGVLFMNALINKQVSFTVSDDFFLGIPRSYLSNGKHPETHPEARATYHENVLGNYEPKTIPKVEGNAENGKPFYHPESKDKEAKESYMEYGINVVASDIISPNRTIPDNRMTECKYWSYPKELPSTSVIIPFHNEALSVLMRTVHSIINRSPPNILKEVVLVDDFSDKKKLKKDLENYIKRWNGKVRLIRNLQREGLIRTRSKGAYEATGDVIVFLDAHCEVNINWLPPLLTPIYRDYNTVTVPVVEGIDPLTFSYQHVYSDGKLYTGIFEWGLLYKETSVPKREAVKHKYRSEPYASPTHAGGLLAINRKYFLQMGAYDPGLLVWGGENYDLSFKVWQCGGRVEWVPCSLVGHIYRPARYGHGTLAKTGSCELLLSNFRRVVETWFDEEHKEYFYARQPLARYCDMGDISDRIAIKENMKCKNFTWFMENVAYELYDSFPKLPKNRYWGTVRNKAYNMCLDTLSKDAPAVIGVSKCHDLGGVQLFRLNERGQLGAGERCVVANPVDYRIQQIHCKLGTVDGPWSYDVVTQQLLYTKLNEKCLTLKKQSRSLTLSPCKSRANQKWIISHDHLDAVKSYRST